MMKNDKCISNKLSTDPRHTCTDVSIKRQMLTLIIFTLWTNLITCIDINIFLWQKQLNYSIFILLYCHVKSSEFVGLRSKKNNIIKS